MKWTLLSVLFVILTNPLSAQLSPAPESLTAVRWSKKNCQNFGEGGVGCREAKLHFTLTSVKPPSKGLVDVVFRPGGGAWTMTVRYTPSLCTPLSGDWWVCKGVSWRVPES